MDCLVCFDKCTKQPHRKPVVCTYCEAVACVRCVETHITSSHQDPHCFNCRHGWTYEFLEANLPKTWYTKDFRNNREHILMDRERSRLPVSQGWAERLKKARDVYGPAAEKAYKEKTAVLEKITKVHITIDELSDKHRKKYRKEFDKIWSAIFDNERKMKAIVRKSEKMTNEDKDIYNELKRKNMKLKREQAAINKILSDELKPYKEEVKELNIQLRILRATHSSNNMLKAHYMDLTDEEFNLNQERERIERELLEQNQQGAEDPMVRHALVESLLATVKNPGEKRAFTMKCPVPECRGFLNTHYKCGLCERSTCPHCLNLYSEIDPEGRKHICKEEEKESVKEIKKNCRNCPSCGMSIFRIEGCNQMFCTGCNTAFDWATGRELVTNQIHNPHYSEYLRKMGLTRDTHGAQLNNNGAGPGAGADARAGFGGCDGMPTIRDFYTRYMARYEQILSQKSPTNSLNSLMYRNFIGYRPVVANDLYEYYRIIGEIRTLHIPDINETLVSIRDNRRINAEYLAGMATEDQWKKKLSKNEASRIVYSEVVDSYQAFVAVGRDIMMNYADHMIDFEKSLDADDARIYNASTQSHIAKRTDFYEKHGKRLQDIYDEAVKQLDMLKFIFNKKMFELVKTYRVECMILTRNADSYTILNKLSYSALKYTTLEEDGTIHVEPPKPQTKSENA